MADHWQGRTLTASDATTSTLALQGAAVSRRLRQLLKRYWLAIVAIVALVGGAWLLYGHATGGGAFGRSAAGLLMQLAFLVLAGTVLDALIKRINRARDKEQELRNKRMDLMRRMREAHVSIANAQRLIYACPSRETYSEQMRVLMHVTPQLEDIERDIAATTDLFCKEPMDKEGIQKGINEIVKYLDEGYDQYATWGKREVDRAWIPQANMGWIAELLASQRGMPDRYFDALTESKGRIRSYVYGDGVDKAEPKSGTVTTAKPRRTG
jgi:hypothetical protein